jgi:uncharacterized protein YkwD
MRLAIRPVCALALALVAIALPAGAASADAPSDCFAADALPGQVSNEALGDATVCLVNAERRAHGLRQLRVGPRLVRAALAHVEDMVGNLFFAHESLDGSGPSERIARTGYMGRRRRWIVGENLAYGTHERSTPRSIVRAWMNSPAHRDNILFPRFRHIGVGVVAGVPVPGLFPVAATYAHEFGTKR